ncbi:MAG: hypothetical protein JWM35_1416, partial [Verrucomicrobia bacterium]|nr:hypothetical protein [Verrucomicrobiota bacterium]
MNSLTILRRAACVLLGISSAALVFSADAPPAKDAPVVPATPVVNPTPIQVENSVVKVFSTMRYPDLMKP